MFNKNNKLTYRFQNNTLNDKDVAETLIKKILVKATPTSSCWWSKMKHRTDGFKDNIDRIKGDHANFIKKVGQNTNPNRGTTAKTCPGILGLFNQTYLIKSPTDIIITITKTGEFLYDVADSSICNLEEHNQEEFFQEDNQLFKNKKSIKFALGISIKTTGFGYVLSDPTYHSNSGFFVPTGLINEKYSNNQQLNIITLIDIPKEAKTVIIKEGDVLAYLIPFEKCSLSFSKENFIYKRFIKGFNTKQWFDD